MMKKILIAALATSFALGVGDSYASELSTTPDTEVISTENTNETLDENIASQNDDNVVIYEIEPNDPNDGPDYIILYNKGNEPVSLNGWYIEDDKGEAERFTLADRTIGPNEQIKLEKDQAGSFTFGIGKNDALSLYNANGDLIQAHSWTNKTEGIIRYNLETGSFDDISDADLSVNEEPTDPTDDTTTSPETTDPAPSAQASTDIVINEVESDDEKEPDYVELYNNGSEAISLDGWYILDDKDDRELTKLDGVSLNPGEYFVLEKDIHFKFGLGNGDAVRLYDKDNNLVDNFSYDSHAFGVYSRYPDGTGDFVDAEPSKGKANTEAVDRTIKEAQSTNIIINEVQQKGANDAPDYVELKNISDKEVSLSGWYILDDDLTRKPEPVGEGVVIPANGYYVLENGTHFSFGLGKNDEVNLFNPQGEIADSFAWQGHAKGKVYARDEETGEFSITNPSPARKNDSKTKEELAAEKPVVINEIESSPDGGGKDYAEIFNRSDEDIDISGWYILDNKATVDKVTKLKEGTILKPGDYYAFEQGVDFDFGLGSNDEVNLYDKDGNIVDKISWTSHAQGTLGRYPNGFGSFTNTSPTKGRENLQADDPVAGVDTDTWPGLEDITILDEVPAFDISDLSGLDNKDGWLYGVNNKEGRFFVFHIVDGKVEFAPGFDSKGKSVNFKNEESKAGPDSEGITVDDEGRVYLAVERDNSNKNENFNVILQVADPFKDEKTMMADKEWNITNLLPDVGANLGIETIEWVPFENLNGLLFDQNKNKALDKNDYKDAYADGVFFVGVEANGHIYALILREDETAEVIADIDTGLGGVMGMDYDLTNNVLWSQADDGYKNIHTVIQFNGTNSPKIIHLDAPKQMDNRLNNEGFVIDPKVDEDGNRNTYWFKDGEDKNAFRNGKLKADYMTDLGLSVIPGKEVNQTPEEDDKDDKKDYSKEYYIKAIIALINLQKIEKDQYLDRLEKAETNYQTIYQEAKDLSSSRVRVPSVDKKSKSDLIYVGKGYKSIKAGTYYRKDLEAKREKLKEALKKNEIQAQAAKFLLEYTPKTVEKIKGELEDLIKEAEKLQEQARVALREVDEILK